jgi:hypothetical protein
MTKTARPLKTAHELYRRRIACYEVYLSQFYDAVKQFQMCSLQTPVPPASMSSLFALYIQLMSSGEGMFRRSSGISEWEPSRSSKGRMCIGLMPS